MKGKKNAKRKNAKRTAGNMFLSRKVPLVSTITTMSYMLLQLHKLSILLNHKKLRIVGCHNSNRNNSVIYDINPSYLSIFCRPDGTYTTYCNEAVLLVIFHSLAWDQFFWETHSGIQWRLASSGRMYQKVCNWADNTHFSIGFGWGKSEMKQEKLLGG